MTVQSVRFNVDEWSAKEARRTLRRFGFRRLKHVDRTRNWLRYRIAAPVHGARYRTVEAGPGIQMILMNE